MQRGALGQSRRDSVVLRWFHVPAWRQAIFPMYFRHVVAWGIGHCAQDRFEILKGSDSVRRQVCEVAWHVRYPFIAAAGISRCHRRVGHGAMNLFVGGALAILIRTGSSAS
eukprot:1377023-Amorphochlora_amoeboformis.AAC.2